MLEVHEVRLFDRNKEADEKVKAARREIDLALLKMDRLLDRISEQTEEAKEEISGGRSG